MAFRFSLQAVLRVRQTLERREELLLLKSNQRVDQVRSQITDLDRYLEARDAQRLRELTKGRYASELQFELLETATLRSRRTRLVEELKQVEALRDEQRGVFQKARMAREILESLRDRQLRDYHEEKRRRDQRSLDDLFLMRHKMAPHG